MISGVVPINKPEGFTSFDVVAKLRGILKIKRIGHSGTLDPMATGVLPVFVGRATKAIDIIPDRKKEYAAGFSLGFSTDTLDITGNITERSGAKASEEEVRRALSGFIGKITQIPPMYSAVRVGGKRLYDLAREGKTVERPPREIEIFSLELSEFDGESGSGKIEMCCSKGTYVRTLIDDLGRKLGTLGTMTSLVRTYSQGFSLGECIGIEEFAEAFSERGGKALLSVERCFEEYPKIELSAAQERMFKSGVRLDGKRIRGFSGDGVYRAEGSEFLGLAEAADREVRVLKSLWETEND